MREEMHILDQYNTKEKFADFIHYIAENCDEYKKQDVVDLFARRNADAKFETS
jgi:hypothetical protein